MLPFLFKHFSPNEAYKLKNLGRPLMMLGVLCTLVAALVYAKANRDYEVALAAYRANANYDAHIAAARANDVFGDLYRDLRTISLLPGIRQIDRTGRNVDANAQETIQQIYTNLRDTVTVSEIYVVPADFNPTKVGGAGGSAQAPLLVLDQKIDGHGAKGVPDADAPDEDETQEYALLRRHIAWLRMHYPREENVRGAALPMISGDTIITCDNTLYASSHNDEDRRGLLFSVPFYGHDGRLKGTISAVILGRVFKEMLPDADYALLSPAHHINLSKTGGQDELSTRWVQQAAADPNLLYSEVIPLEVNDPQSVWQLWVGLPNSRFYKSGDIAALRMFQWMGYSLVAGLLALGLVGWLISQRHLRHMQAQLLLEQSEREALAAAAAAQKANAAKGDFLANMSHELRTPMNGVLGMTNLLADTELTDEQRQYVAMIASSGENLLALLNDILDISKIEAGALTLERVAFDFRQICHEAMQPVHLQAEQKSLSLMEEIDSAVPQYVWGDPVRVRQLIVNLMGNSVKFTERGYVRLAAGIQERDGASYLHVRVEDTGIGIPADKLAIVFDKFTQADVSVTRKFGGTGLGLAITSQLVGLMQGEMGVESVEGKGSTFWFMLPCIAANETDLLVSSENIETMTHVSRTKMPVAEVRVLLVEDYPVNQIFAQKLLRKFGFRHIDTAQDGVEALGKYDENHYDIIFMDCQMPRLDGYITTQEIRLREAMLPGMPHTPIIAMTANAMMGDREKCLASGMDDYLSKPLRMAHLKRLLESLVLLDTTTDLPETGKRSSALIEKEELPVDMEQLRIFTEDDPAEERELVTLFLDQAHSVIAVLRGNMAADQADTWKSAAHRLKGASGNLGAMKLHHLCRRAEMQSDDPSSAKQEMLAAIQNETRRVEAFFTQRAGQH